MTNKENITIEQYYKAKKIIDLYLHQVTIKNHYFETVLKINPPTENIYIKDIDMGIRLYNCLRQEFKEIWDNLTIMDIAYHTKNDFIKFRNLGNTSVNELENILKKFGLNFAKENEQ